MYTLAPARLQDLPLLSALCLRSKAYWGYDAEFMAACEAVLTLSPADLETLEMIAAWHKGALAGMAAVSCEGTEGHLDKLFVDPPFIGKGLGKQLYGWAVSTLLARNATTMRIEADPDAAPFYTAMGALRIGEAPSEAIPGRNLPLLEHRLQH